MGTNTYGYAYDPIGNRLAATNAASGLALEFAYDHQGRRISKQVSHLESEIWNVKSQKQFA